MSTLRLSLISLTILLFSTTAWGQSLGVHEAFMTWTEFVEEFLAAESERETVEGEGVLRHSGARLDQLEEWVQSPLNLNTASHRDLLELGIITAEQADSLLAYRQRVRAFSSLGELLLVRNLSYRDRRWLSLFTFAGDTLRPRPTLAQRLLNGHHTLDSHIRMPLYRRAGFILPKPPLSSTERQRYYLGPNLGHSLRYRYQWHQKLRYGLTLANDTGEPFAAYGHRPYDFASAHLVVGGTSDAHQLFLGDYTVQWGEGLLLGRLFMGGGLGLLLPSTRHSTRIRPHTSGEEERFFRGAAARKQWRRWELSAFASYRRRSARITNDTIRSLPINGLHRSLRELAGEGRAGVLTLGARATLHSVHNHLGIGAYVQTFNHFVQPDPRPYNRHYFHGRHTEGLSLDWSIGRQSWQTMGELATDGQGHLAWSQRLLWTPRESWFLAMQARWLSTAFSAPEGETVQQGSHTQNEQGTTLAFRWHATARLELRGSIDLARHPAPTYRADTTARGVELRIEAEWGGTSALAHTLTYRLRSAETDISDRTAKMPRLEWRATHHLRWQTRHSTLRWIWIATLDAALHRRQTRPSPSLGGLAALRTTFHPTPRIALTATALAFHTDDHDSRIYLYLPHLRHAGGFPTFSGRGAAFVALAQWQWDAHWDVAARYAVLHYTDRNHIGTGVQRIDSPTQNDLDLTLRFRF